MALAEINVRSDLEKYRKQLDNFGRQQFPFATALALTRLAKRVQVEERLALPRVFDRPTPFTLNAFGVKPATKAKPEAVVFAKDRQARYLEPYEFGGRQVPHKEAILTPKAIRLNQYGNIPRGRVASLKAGGDVFVGAVSTRSGGKVSGVWERYTKPRASASGVRFSARRGGYAPAGEYRGVRLLVRFTDPQAISPKLNFRKRAAAVVRNNFQAEMRGALDRAMETRK